MTSPSRFKLIERLRKSRVNHRQRSRFIRSGATVLGFLLVAAGAVMLVTPGPAFAVIPAGLYLLALEYDWAEKLLEKALERAENAKDGSAMRGLGRFIKRHPRLSAVIVAILLTVIVGVVIWFVSPETITNRI